MKFESFFKLQFFIFAIWGSIAHGITINGTLDSFATNDQPSFTSTTGQQTGRLGRVGLPSDCVAPKPNPGLFATTGDRQYDQYRFIALSSGCVTVTLSDAGDNVLFGVAYSGIGVFESDPSVNYLADMASSPTTGIPSRSFSFQVEAGQPFSIVIHEVSVGSGIGQSYVLDIDGVKIEPDFTLTETIDLTDPIPNAGSDGSTITQNGRLNRNGTESTCDSPKANPGLFTAAGVRQLDRYEFMPNASGCAILTLSHTGMDSTYVAVYDENGYSNADITANYLADAGASAVNSSIVFSFNVQEGVPFTVVVHETNPGAGIGDNYTLNISNVPVAHTIRIGSRLDAAPPPAHPDWTTGGGNQTGRMNRNGLASDCGGPKANPGLLTTTGSRLFDQYTIIPINSGCVEVTLVSTDGNLFHTAHDQNGFNPADPSLNYLADPGQSTTESNPSHTFAFQVTAGVPFTIVVSEVNSTPGISEAYILTLQGNALFPLGDFIFSDGMEN